MTIVVGDRRYNDVETIALVSRQLDPSVDFYVAKRVAWDDYIAGTDLQRRHWAILREWPWLVYGQVEVRGTNGQVQVRYAERHIRSARERDSKLDEVATALVAQLLTDLAETVIYGVVEACSGRGRR